jgi:anti-sigma B factor antagonist
VSAVVGADVKTSVRAGYVVVALRGELDICTAADGVRALTAAAASGSRIIVDLTDLAFMDCSALRELVSARMQAWRAGGDLLLAGPQPPVLRLLVLTDMLDLFQVFACVDEAVSGAASAPPVPLTPELAGSEANSPHGEALAAGTGIVP